MFLPRHQSAGQNHGTEIASRCFKNVAQIRYLGTTVINQNLIQEEIKKRLNSGNACYHSVQELLLFRLLSEIVKIRIYKTIILPVVLYWYETSSLILREKHRMRVFENRVLRKIFGPKRSGVRGGIRKLHKEGLHNLHSSTSIIRMINSRRMRWAGHVVRMGAKRNACRILVGKPDAKRPLGGPRHMWEDNITMDVREIGWYTMDWIDLAQDRDQWMADVNTVLNFQVA
jgi:hypothetical protein